MFALTLIWLFDKVRRMYSTVFTRFLLIFVLLFTQLGGMVHGISHTLAEQGSDQSLPHDKYCDQCAAYAQIGSAIGGSGIIFFSSENFETLHSNHHGSFTSNTFVAFAARAPPYSA